MIPKLSVIMSVYNEERYVEKAVNSILTQTYKDFEFIIINDGSTDRTQEILEAYADKRIKLIKHENLGLTRSLNKGLKHARGEFIARMDGDDISLPERLAKQVEFLNDNRNVGLVGSFLEHIDEAGKFIKYYTYPVNTEEIKNALWSDCPFCHSVAMFRKECIAKVGDYREKIGPAEDYDLWFRISEHFDVGNIAKVLHKYRIRPKGISINHRFDQIRSSFLVRVLAIQRQRKGTDDLHTYTDESLEDIINSVFPRNRKNVKSVRYSNYAYLADVLYCTGDYRQSFHWLIKSFSIKPNALRSWILAVKLFLCSILPPEKVRYLKNSFQKTRKSFPGIITND